MHCVLACGELTLELLDLVGSQWGQIGFDWQTRCLGWKDHRWAGSRSGKRGMMELEFAGRPYQYQIRRVGASFVRFGLLTCRSGLLKHLRLATSPFTVTFRSHSIRTTQRPPHPVSGRPFWLLPARSKAFRSPSVLVTSISPTPDRTPPCSASCPRNPPASASRPGFRRARAPCAYTSCPPLHS